MNRGKGHGGKSRFGHGVAASSPVNPDWAAATTAQQMMTSSPDNSVWGSTVDADSREEQKGVAAIIVASSSVGILGLLLEQWSSFLNLLNSRKALSPDYDALSGKIENEWILDSASSHHMTGRKVFLSNTKPFPPYTFTLPNGSKTTGDELGSSSLHSILNIDNVQVTPQAVNNLVANNIEPLNLRRSNRPHRPPEKLKDYICHMVWASPSISLSSASPSSSGPAGLWSLIARMIRSLATSKSPHLFEEIRLRM
ncbi:hypothetical protein M9H77_29818 [Catharanthus roseus]|uniref:Uncharacterized protein n=1 Tax=Catharanthus roseus TaxID=4058 RepID=A0ACB9ZVU8_CATRO|nr:hypothetical protein M9H77_29818 [Catharanthus roseus]